MSPEFHCLIRITVRLVSGLQLNKTGFDEKRKCVVMCCYLLLCVVMCCYLYVEKQLDQNL